MVISSSVEYLLFRRSIGFAVQGTRGDALPVPFVDLVGMSAVIIFLFSFPFHVQIRKHLG